MAVLNDDRVLIMGGYFSSALVGQHYLFGSEIFIPPVDYNTTGRYVPGAGMYYSRLSSSATTLKDGRVLVVGGQDERGLLNSSEIYDPDANNFSLVEGLTEKRRSHTATLLESGDVLIVGGDTVGPGHGHGAELLNSTTGKFQPTAEDTCCTRTQHTATLLNDGRVLVVGDRYSEYGELYTPDTGTFSNTTGRVIEKRIRHMAAKLNDGRVLIIGGQNEKGRYLNNAEIYDPGTDNFYLTENNLRVPRSDGSAFPLPDGKVIILKGRSGREDYLTSVDIFDPETNLFYNTSIRTKTDNAYYSAVQLNDGRVLISGGRLEGSRGASIFDPTITGIVYFYSNEGMFNYTCSLIQGEGRLNPETCQFLSSPVNQNVTIRLTDDEEYYMDVNISAVVIQ